MGTIFGSGVSGNIFTRLSKNRINETVIVWELLRYQNDERLARSELGKYSQY
jgi:hypothetical protein